MRLASDLIESFAAVWLLGSMFAISRWSQKPDGSGGSRMPDAYLKRDAITYAWVAVFFAFVGLIVRVW